MTPTKYGVPQLLIRILNAMGVVVLLSGMRGLSAAVGLPGANYPWAAAAVNSRASTGGGWKWASFTLFVAEPHRVLHLGP